MSSSRIFFTSDTHFGHGNIIKYSNRPFLTELDKEEFAKESVDFNRPKWRVSQEAIAAMDNELLKQINDMVGENDVLYHLGDFALPGKYNYYQRCHQYRNRIKCKNVIIIWGNHDDRSIYNLFSADYDLKYLKVPDINKDIVLCHYAMAIWNKCHKGSWHLYGHSHSTAEPWLDTIMNGRRSIDVGVDNAAKIFGKYRPFSLDELKEIFKTRTGFSADHHVER